MFFLHPRAGEGRKPLAMSFETRSGTPRGHGQANGMQAVGTGVVFHLVGPDSSCASIWSVDG